MNFLTQFGLTADFGWLTFVWWTFLFLFWKLMRVCVGYRKINTFTFLVPLILVTNGIFVPFTRNLNELVSFFALTQFGPYWISLLIMYLVIPLGVLCANLFRAPRPFLDQDFSEAMQLRAPGKVRVYFFAVFAISFVSLLMLYSQGLLFDLVSYLSGQMDYFQYARHRYSFADATASWPYALYNKLPYGLAPLALVLLWNAATVKAWEKVGLLLMFVFAIVQTGHKMPVIVVLVTLVFSRLVLRREFRLERRSVMTVAVISLVVVLVFIPTFYILQGGKNYGNAISWALTRTLWETERTLQLYFEAYPKYHPFLHGASTSTVAFLIEDNEYVPPSVYIPRALLDRDDTSFPALFIGEAWADFGYVGVAISAFLVGFILQLYNVWFFNQRRPGLEEAGLFVSIILSDVHLLESNVLTTFFTYGLFSSLVIYFLIRGEPFPQRRQATGLDLPPHPALT